MLKEIITAIWAKAQSGLFGASYVCCFWGDQSHLDRFLQRYAVERCFIEARRKGHLATEQQLEDGSVKVTIQVSG